MDCHGYHVILLESDVSYSQFFSKIESEGIECVIGTNEIRDDYVSTCKVTYVSVRYFSFSC